MIELIPTLRPLDDLLIANFGAPGIWLHPMTFSLFVAAEMYIQCLSNPRVFDVP